MTLFARAVALLATIHLTAVPAGSQVKEVVVKWPELNAMQTTALRSGQSVLVKVLEVGPLCYDVHVSLTQAAAASSAVGELVGLIRGTTDLETLLGHYKLPGATPSTGPAPAGAGADFPLAEKWMADEVEAPLNRAITLLNSADSAAKALSKLETDAAGGLAKFWAGACPAGTRGGTSQVATVEWGKQATKVTAFSGAGNQIKEANALVKRVGEELAAGSRGWDHMVQGSAPQSAEYIKTPSGATRIRASQYAIKGLTGDLATAKANVDKLGAAQKEMATTVEGIPPALEKADVITLPVYLRNDSERLVVLITATGRKVVPTTANTKFEDKFEIPITRRRRTFESVGPAIILGGDFPRYARTVVLDTANPGKTKAVYADRNGGKGYALAPTVFGHMTLSDSDAEVSLLGTLGIGARRIGGNARPDFFFGLSIGFGDRFIATLAVPFGWREELIDPALKTGPVPTEINDDSAIRTVFKSGIALALSFRP